MIIRFGSREEYERWLSWQNSDTKQKAAKFTQQYPDVIPLILAVDAYTPQGGEWAEAYVFVHPQAEELLSKLVV